LTFLGPGGILERLRLKVKYSFLLRKQYSGRFLIIKIHSIDNKQTVYNKHNATMSASRDQIDAALGQMTTHGRYFANWHKDDLQRIILKPKEAIEELRLLLVERRRKIVIPTSNRTDSGVSFYLNIGGRVDLLSLYENTILCDPKITTFDHLSRHLIFSDHILHRSDFPLQEKLVAFKVMTQSDFGFEDHVETGDFMNDEFLEIWSRKHYGNRTLSLCQDTDFLFFAGNPELGFNIGFIECVIFAAEPVQHFSSGGLYIFAVRAMKEVICRNIFTIAAHPNRTYPLTQKFVFRIASNEPKTRSARSKGKRK
jgi:hypothetical protein